MTIRSEVRLHVFQATIDQCFKVFLTDITTRTVPVDLKINIVLASGSGLVENPA